MDLLRQLGPLAIASRLRRLTEWLYKDGARIYQELSLDFEPRWFPLFYLLKESGEISVTHAAQALGMTHPAINQIAGEMSRRGFAESISDKKDKRKRLLRLTQKGRKALSSLEPVWKDFKSAASDLLSEAGDDFLATVERLEDALKEKGMYERITQRIKNRQLKRIQILNYQPQFKKYFKSLNYEWLREYFKVEKEDKKLLSSPYERIIKPGGFVLFARLNGKIVGTTALIKHDRHTYELTKMAVKRTAQRQQVGRKLALAAIEKAKNSGAKRVILLTSPRLTAAYNLYRSLGFIELSGDQPWATLYHRGGIPLSLDLKNKP
ncbi:MAG: bifunctional helix-turn-helix transcriptional regulator/GNAT family N-acetyltransferase [candidate division Zixibacteria bacterium]|nr:bifunctional helix-turn-helix transcriptional regulator/GNAT family N-acetyltransferase [candidate division Zixibacteria bacterium]